jgi:hypothetical protein
MVCGHHASQTMVRMPFSKLKSVKHNADEAHPHSGEELKEDICRKVFSLSQEQICYTKGLEAFAVQ